MKEKGIEFNTQWKLIARVKPYSPATGRCNLCLKKKYFIIFEPTWRAQTIGTNCPRNVSIRNNFYSQTSKTISLTRGKNHRYIYTAVKTAFDDPLQIGRAALNNPHKAHLFTTIKYYVHNRDCRPQIYTANLVVNKEL